MPKRSCRLRQMIAAFRGRFIGVLGDFMLDELLLGEAKRISPEAPVPIVQVDGHPSPQRYPGGTGNVAVNIRALGGHPIPFGAIGTDESGENLLKELRTRGIPCGTLVKERGRVTPHKLRIVAHQHQLLRLDFEKPAPISPRTIAYLARSFARWAPRLNALIISDYRKGSVEPHLCSEIIALARQRRLPVFVDPKPEHPEICRHATVVTPNLREAELMAGVSLRDRGSLEAAGRRLIAELDCSNLLITRGAEGMTLFEKDGTVHEIASVARPVYDVTGAGDTVLAVVALALCAGAKMKEAAELANRAAGLIVLKFGTSHITSQELLHAAAVET